MIRATITDYDLAQFLKVPQGAVVTVAKADSDGVHEILSSEAGEYRPEWSYYLYADECPQKWSYVEEPLYVSLYKAEEGAAQKAAEVISSVLRANSGENPKQRYGDKKVAMHNVPPVAEIYLALAMQDGAAKYGPFNWRETSVQAMTYVGAIKRHLAAWVDGENNAKDSGYPHLGHIMACCAILADAFENGVLTDNRPPAGPAGRVLEEYTKP